VALTSDVATGRPGDKAGSHTPTVCCGHYAGDTPSHILNKKFSPEPPQTPGVCSPPTARHHHVAAMYGLSRGSLVLSMAINML
jgi:hypothetical protein